MESTARIKLTDRFALLNDWLKNTCQLENIQLIPMTPDASFRRYYRIAKNQQSYVLMDAPPPEKSCVPFVEIAKCLRAHDLHAPEVFHTQLDEGFLLLSDLGNTTYLSALNISTADSLYKQALNALAKICRIPSDLPKFTAELMQQEWFAHKEWFLEKYLQFDYSPYEAVLNQCMSLIIDAAIGQTQVFMHRDYHSANLMVLEDDVGILDFQDAFLGPVTYDLVSLLRDCYIEWPAEKVMHWVEYYYQLITEAKIINVDLPIFVRWFDLMGLQRHLKALLTFARKKVRDDHSQYLKHIPRTVNYVIAVSANYPELKGLHDFYKEHVKPLCAR